MTSQALKIVALQSQARVIEDALAKLQGLLSKVRLRKAEEYSRVQEPYLLRENVSLKRQVADLCQLLKTTEISKGIKQVAVPADRCAKVPHSPERSASGVTTPIVSDQPPTKQSRFESPPSKPMQSESTEVRQLSTSNKSKTAAVESSKRKKGEGGSTKKSGKGGGAAAADERPVDISRIVMKAGRIVDVKKHPDADSLYLETVDVGEEKPRTIISGLVKHYSLEEMQNRLAIFMCNLKPAKMRGILSEGMIMCASGTEKVHIIDLPSGTQVGDRIVFSKFTGEPDDRVDAKKKIWEQILPGLKTNSDGVATYLGDPFTVEGREGVCKAKACPNYPIK